MKSRYSILWFVFIILNFFHLSGQDLSKNQFKWNLHEEYTYKVKYSFIRLGTLKLSVDDTSRIDGHKVYKIMMYVDSNPILFWVNMHSVFEVYMDESFRPVLFYSNENIDGVNYRGTFKFNYNKKTVTMNYRSVEDSTKFINKESPFDDIPYDGLSLIFFARGNVGKNKPDTLLVMVEDKRGPVIINFTDKESNIEIGALDDELNCYYIDGELLVEGIAGVSGPYEGWFSRDSHRVPLYAKMKVFIGSVNIELEEWKNWNYIAVKN
ncbi:MAG: DUF3108 domain-containing protein [Calditrichaceae bacterium]|nr:DUF3108 domain-containing protein [Calditrichaceae bacterium]RQV94523.1 MAG: DUF3108 domain-containing protein [Calditrichota bacterium]